MLFVVPVASALEGQHLMVCGIEVLHTQIVIEASRWGCYLNGSCIGIEVGIARERTLSRIFDSGASTIGCCPTAEGITRGNGNLGSVELECANFCIFLYLLCSDNCLAIGVNIGQGVERLANEVGNPLHVDVVVADRNGNYCLLVIAYIGHISYSTSCSDNVGKGVGAVNHLVGLEELNVGYIVVTDNLEDVIYIIVNTISLERGQDRNFLLFTSQCTFNNDVGKAYLFGVAQAVEVDLKSALAFGWCGTSDIITIDGWSIAVVVAVGFLFLGQNDSGAVWIYPCKIKFATISAIAC